MDDSQPASTTITAAVTRSRRMSTPESLSLLIDALEKAKLWILEPF